MPHLSNYGKVEIYPQIMPIVGKGLGKGLQEGSPQAICKLVKICKNSDRLRI